METTLTQPPAAKANLRSRLAGFARTALAAAAQRKPRPSSIAHRPLAAPQALATIIRPQARERWLLPQVAAITPTYIEMTLRGALAGAHIPQWELFNLMEDTWPRLRKNVLELKMAVRSRRPVFEAYRDEDAEESPTATERMKLVSAALRHMQPDPAADEGAFDDLVTDILDAWFKGVSVLEIDWHITQTRALGRFVAPRAARWVSPVHYAWDENLRLGLDGAALSPASDSSSSVPAPRRANPRTPTYSGETPLTSFPSDRFLIAQCKTKSGSVLGGALLRPLVWWWCAANFSADWLLKFAELFGIPKPKAGEATLADTKEEASMPPSEMDSSATGNSFPFLAWDADKHPRNAIGQFARTASDTTGSNGPRGNTTENIQKAHVDPGVKDMPVEKVKDHYRTFVKRSTEIYEQNKAFLENNLFSTAVGRPDTVAIDNHGDIKKTPKVDPAALKLWKQIFLDDGTTKTGEKEKNLGECVSLVSNLTGITPDRTKWRPGARVVDSDNIKPGTAIATFNDKGVYDPRDNPHAAIFISKGTNSEGRDYILILEQFNPGHKARHPQTRALFLAPEPSDPSKRDYSNCSNYFHVIETT